MKKILVLFLAVTLIFTAISFGEERETSLFKDIADEAVSFFAPLSGPVIEANESGAVIGIGSDEGVREGMRMKVFRAGDEFRHPVTGEPLGKIETEVGDVEVESVDTNSSTVIILNGKASKGDRVRISRGTLRVLFYQTREVDWAAGDALFRALKNTGRFDIEEISKDRDSLEVMLEEMRTDNAVFGIFIQQTTMGDTEVVKVAFYHPDGKQFYKKDVVLSPEDRAKLKFGYNYLKEVETETSTQWVMDVSSSMGRITSCDVDGDGKDELGAIQIMSLDKELASLYSKEIGGNRESLSLDCQDLDGDGRAEIAATFIKGYEEPGDEEEYSPVLFGVFYTVESIVCSLEGDEIVETAAEQGFMRIVENALYMQAFDRETGYSGPVYSVAYEKGIGKKRETILPSGVNIYDFYPAGEGTFFVDDAAYVNLINKKGTVVWRSSDNLGGFIQSYVKGSPTVMVDKGRWSVKDRMVPYKGSLILIKRIPTATTAKGLGYSSTDIVEIASKEGSITMTPVLSGIEGTVHDFTVIDDKLVLLVKRSFAKTALDLFKGESPFKRNLYLFPLKED